MDAISDGLARRVPTRAQDAMQRRLLDRAGELFHQFGFKRVTMDELTLALGISKKTLYKYVEGKDALIETFVLDLVDRTVEEVSMIFDDEPDIVELTNRLVAYMGSRIQTISAVMMIDLQRHWPHLWEKINARRMKVIERYLEVIERSRRQGVIRSDINPRLVVKMVQAVVSEVMHPKTFLEMQVAPREAIKTIVTVLLYGALTDVARPGEEEDDARVVP